MKLKEILAIRIRRQIARRSRDVALFNLAIDSKLRSCDLVCIRVRWVSDIGLDPAGYGTHSIRRTKATLIYRRMTEKKIHIRSSRGLKAPLACCPRCGAVSRSEISGISIQFARQRTIKFDQGQAGPGHAGHSRACSTPQKQNPARGGAVRVVLPNGSGPPSSYSEAELQPM